MRAAAGTSHFTGSSLGSVLVAVEAGLGLSLVPVGAARGYRVRRHAGLGPEPAMRVSLYAWETTGQVAELAARMAAMLAERYEASGGA